MSLLGPIAPLSWSLLGIPHEETDGARSWSGAELERAYDLAFGRLEAAPLPIQGNQLFSHDPLAWALASPTEPGRALPFSRIEQLEELLASGDPRDWQRALSLLAGLSPEELLELILLLDQRRRQRLLEARAKERAKSRESSGSGSNGGTSAAGTTPPAQGSEVKETAKIEGTKQDTKVGYHVKPDVLTNASVGNDGNLTEESKQAIDAELASAKSAGAESVTMVLNAGSTSPAATSYALERAAEQGLTINLRANHGDWSETLPLSWDQAAKSYAYDPTQGGLFLANLEAHLGGLSEQAKSALGAVQLGNEPLMPTEWNQFLGQSWGRGASLAPEYQQWLSANGVSAEEVASGMGSAIRDMFEDIGPRLEQMIGREHVATPPPGAGLSPNPPGSQAVVEAYYLGLMGEDGRGSAFEHAGRVGVHAYLNKDLFAAGRVGELSDTFGYDRALDAYRARFGEAAPGTEDARPVFTEAALDNRWSGGQSAALDGFIEGVVNAWNVEHPGAEVASIDLWGRFAGYAEQFESEWTIDDQNLAPAVRFVNQAAGVTTAGEPAATGAAYVDTNGVPWGIGYGAEVRPHLGNPGDHTIYLRTPANGIPWQVRGNGQTLAEGVTETKNGQQGMAEIPVWPGWGNGGELWIRQGEGWTRIAGQLGSGFATASDQGGDGYGHHSFDVVWNQPMG